MSFVAECEKLMELYERLEELDADKAEVRASRILHGLGFSSAMQRKKLKDFSGGWRMRVALARYWRQELDSTYPRKVTINVFNTFHKCLFYLLL